MALLMLLHANSDALFDQFLGARLVLKVHLVPHDEEGRAHGEDEEDVEDVERGEVAAVVRDGAAGRCEAEEGTLNGVVDDVAVRDVAPIRCALVFGNGWKRALLFRITVVISIFL